MALVKFVSSLTLEQYNALATKDANTLYFPSDSNKIYKGSVLIGEANSVSSVNSKTGAVTISLSDLGGADSLELTGNVTGTATKSGTKLSVATTIANDAVETAKIKDANVTEAKIASDAVVTAKIKDKNVTSAKIQDSVALAGTPTAPTANSGSNTTQIATTAFVQTEIKNKMETAEAMVLAGVVNASTGKMVSWNDTVLETTTEHPLTTNTLFLNLTQDNGLRAGCTFKVNAAGTIGGIKLEAGDSITVTNVTEESFEWFALQNNVDVATTTARGLVIVPTTGGLSVDANGNISLNISGGNGLTKNATSGQVSMALVSTSAAGAMSAADKTKLDGIEAGANNYSLPTATNTVLGGVKVTEGNGLKNTSGTLSMSLADSSNNGAMSAQHFEWLRIMSGNVVYNGDTEGIEVAFYVRFKDIVDFDSEIETKSTAKFGGEVTFSDNTKISDIISALTWQ